MSEPREKSGMDRLPPNQQLLSAERWPVVGEKHAGDHPPNWPVQFSGELTRPQTVDLEELMGWPRTTLKLDIHCVTRWSKYDMTFEGIDLQHLFSELAPKDSAKYVSFRSFSDRNHSTSLPLAQLKNRRAIVAFSVNGEPLPDRHGGPVRVVVEGKYFYKSLKWLREICFLPEDELGYWEADTGYHNNADPWKEERYLAPSVNKRLAAKLIATRNFQEEDLRSLDASERNLANLNARKACLRNSNFTRANLTHADFEAANLSNAKFINCNLKSANFRNADVEGADFTGADLSDTNFENASLFGATFCNENRSTSLTRTTRFTSQQIESLTNLQQTFLKQHATVLP